MSRIWFTGELETVATFWRVLRRDGIALGFTTHDRDLWFAGLLHRAAPGMVPSAIRRTADLEPDSAEVDGVLSHDAISAAELAAGRYDGASVVIGLVDWQSLESREIYHGRLGTVSAEAGRFNAELLSRKADLALDRMPRTSPTCRAAFCGPGCGLSAARFTHDAVVTAVDPDACEVAVTSAAAGAGLAGGTLRWLDGPRAGLGCGVAQAAGGRLTVDDWIDPATPAGTRVELREGCDHTLATCAARFGNAANFQGEPFLPGNDLVARYPAPAQ